MLLLSVGSCDVTQRLVVRSQGAPLRFRVDHSPRSARFIIYDSDSLQARSIDMPSTISVLLRDVLSDTSYMVNLAPRTEVGLTPVAINMIPIRRLVFQGDSAWTFPECRDQVKRLRKSGHLRRIGPLGMGGICLLVP